MKNFFAAYKPKTNTIAPARGNKAIEVAAPVTKIPDATVTIVRVPKTGSKGATTSTIPSNADNNLCGVSLKNLEILYIT